MDWDNLIWPATVLMANLTNDMTFHNGAQVRHLPPVNICLPQAMPMPHSCRQYGFRNLCHKCHPRWPADSFQSGSAILERA